MPTDNNNDLSTAWEAVKQSKNAVNLLRVLLSGYIPENLEKNVIIVERGLETEIELVRLLLNTAISDNLDPALTDHAKRESIAGKLLDLGAPIPDLPAYKNIRLNLEHLCDNPGDLFLALRIDPQAVFTAHSPRGETLLHCAVTRLCNEAPDIANPVFRLQAQDPAFFKVRNIDFETFLHTALPRAKNSLQGRINFMRYTEIAIQKGIDLNIPMRNGFALIHIVAITKGPYLSEDEKLTYRSLVPEFLSVIKKAGGAINLDLVNAEGATAFCYAIAEDCNDAAEILLKAGA